MDRKPDDPVIDEIRAIRQRISARFNHDPARLVAYYIKRQERHRDRLMDRTEQKKLPVTFETEKHPYQY